MNVKCPKQHISLNCNFFRAKIYIVFVQFFTATVRIHTVIQRILHLKQNGGNEYYIEYFDLRNGWRKKKNLWK